MWVDRVTASCVCSMTNKNRRTKIKQIHTENIAKEQSDRKKTHTKRQNISWIHRRKENIDKEKVILRTNRKIDRKKLQAKRKQSCKHTEKDIQIEENTGKRKR